MPGNRANATIVQDYVFEGGPIQKNVMIKVDVYIDIPRVYYPFNSYLLIPGAESGFLGVVGVMGWITASLYEPEGYYLSQLNPDDTGNFFSAFATNAVCNHSSHDNFKVSPKIYLKPGAKEVDIQIDISLWACLSPSSQSNPGFAEISLQYLSLTHEVGIGNLNCVGPILIPKIVVTPCLYHLP